MYLVRLVTFMPKMNGLELLYKTKSKTATLPFHFAVSDPGEPLYLPEGSVYFQIRNPEPIVTDGNFTPLPSPILPA